jgi:hypothetical protein
LAFILADYKSRKKCVPEGKGKVFFVTGHEGPEWYSYIIYLISVLGDGVRLAPRPGRFTPGKEILYPFYRRLGGPQCLSE